MRKKTISVPVRKSPTKISDYGLARGLDRRIFNQLATGQSSEFIVNQRARKNKPVGIKPSYNLSTAII